MATNPELEGHTVVEGREALKMKEVEEEEEELRACSQRVCQGSRLGLPMHLAYMKEEQLCLLTPSVTMCTNKTDGGQRCRQITSGHLSLHGNSLLNK